MIEPTLLEKILINAYTPIDKLRHLFPEKFLYSIPIIPKECLNNTIDKKIRSYSILINRLNYGEYDKHFISHYTTTPCGRLQLKVAKMNGYLSNEDYDSLKLHLL